MSICDSWGIDMELSECECRCRCQSENDSAPAPRQPIPQTITLHSLRTLTLSLEQPISSWFISFFSDLDLNLDSRCRCYSDYWGPHHHGRGQWWLFRSTSFRISDFLLFLFLLYYFVFFSSLDFHPFCFELLFGTTSARVSLLLDLHEHHEIFRYY